MRISARMSRRIIGGASLAAAAILVPVAALASSAAPTASSASARTAAPARADTPACTSAHTDIWYAQPGDGTAGAIYYQLEFTNIGRATCSFYGYPGVSADGPRGGEVGRPATHSGGRLLVVLAPGQTAHVVLRVTDAGAICAHPENATALRVYAPGQLASMVFGFSSQGCPGTSVLHVDSIHPGTGVPGYTIS